MRQATEKAVPAKPEGEGKVGRDGSLPERNHAAERSAAPQAEFTAGERSRQLLGALRPLLPVVGDALQKVPHGGVRAVARFLPLLGSVGANLVREAPPQAPPSETPQLRAALDKQSAVDSEVKALRETVQAQDDQLRRLRENVERTVAEQGTLTHRVNQLTARAGLLTAGMVILLLCILGLLAAVILLRH